MYWDVYLKNNNRNVALRNNYFGYAGLPEMMLIFETYIYH